jgi:hypothetical protein
MVVVPLQWLYSPVQLPSLDYKVLVKYPCVTKLCVGQNIPPVLTDN